MVGSNGDWGLFYFSLCKYMSTWSFFCYAPALKYQGQGHLSRSDIAKTACLLIHHYLPNGLVKDGFHM